MATSSNKQVSPHYDQHGMKRTLIRNLACAALAASFLGGMAARGATPNDPTLFGITFVRNELVTINPVSGEARIVGGSGETSYPYGIAVRNDRLYTFDQTNNTIREINKISGQYRRTINIGVSGLRGEGDLAFRPADGIGFLASALNENNEPVNDLYRVVIDDNSDVGVAVRLGSTGVAIDALAFDGAGTLYGIGQGSGTLYTIDQTTGATTVVGSLGVAMNSPIAGMTFTPNEPPDAPNGRLLAAIDDRLFNIDTTTGAATPASTAIINFGPLVSSVSGLAVATGSGTLGNMAARVAVGTGENVGIVGFIIRGTPDKRVIIRGLGPSLTTVSGALADPVLELFNSQRVSLERNDDFGSSAEKQEINDSGFAPGNAKESAILRTLPAGSYTAVLSGANSTTGVGLLEIYDLDAGSGSRLANLSARALVQPGDNALIGGLIVSGSTAQQVVLRAIGPDLANRGIANPLADPMIDVYDVNGTLLKSNDNFTMDPDAQEISSQGLAPNNNREAATLLTLEPGNYTAVVRGVGTNNSGVALLESYNLSANNAPTTTPTTQSE